MRQARQRQPQSALPTLPPIQMTIAILWSGLFLATVLVPDGTASAAERQRIAWTESRLTGSPDPPLPYRVERAYPELPVLAPIYLRAEPGSDRMFYIDHKFLNGDGQPKEPGGLRAFTDDEQANATVPLLQMDRLIYGFCFHPQYEQNGYLFVIHNGPMAAANKQNRISRFTVSRDPDGQIVPDSELVILEWDSNGHNGGDLAFGPDGYLYCPTGDGTSDSDTLQTGQGLDDLLAVMLRLDVDHPSADRPYSIPDDNPFVTTPGARPEIWAYGFRNPWRMAFDHQLNQLWVGQNGQDLWEQVYLVKRGENYGWSVQEGSYPFYPERPRGEQPIVNPMAEHHHSQARSLTGGIVYHGARYPLLEGCFIYGDYSTGRIWAIRHDGVAVQFHRELADTTLQIAGFATNRAGDILIADHGGGFYRLETNTQPDLHTEFPRLLSQTGLFESVSEHRMLPSIIPYSVNVQLWSDGASKQRWLAVPGDATIDYTRTRGWNFPNDSVLVKSFALPLAPGTGTASNAVRQRWVETRLLVRQQNEWVGYSYRWNDEQTDARLVESAGTDDVFDVVASDTPSGRRSLTWHYPSRAECMFCHSRAVNFVLGLTEHQMNRVHDYGSEQLNQLQMLSELGLFSKPLPKPIDQLERLSDPFDSTLDLQTRAMAYLHANCSNCHVEAGGGNAQFSVEATAKPDQQRLIDVAPVHTTFGIPNARLIAPGVPEKSVLLHRIEQRGRGQMPPLGSHVVDRPAVELIRAWIAAMPAAPPAETSTTAIPTTATPTASPTTTATPTATPTTAPDNLPDTVPADLPIPLNE